MVDQGVIQRKISKIIYCMGRIEKYQGITEKEFLASPDAVDIVVHNFFVILQNVIDVGTHIIADDNLGDMVFLMDIPDILEREGILSTDYSPRLKAMIGFRNIIAYEYGDIDLKMVYRILKENLVDIYLFMDAITRYCRM